MNLLNQRYQTMPLANSISHTVPYVVSKLHVHGGSIKIVTKGKSFWFLSVASKDFYSAIRENHAITVQYSSSYSI